MNKIEEFFREAFCVVIACILMTAALIYMFRWPLLAVATLVLALAVL